MGAGRLPSNGAGKIPVETTNLPLTADPTNEPIFAGANVGKLPGMTLPQERGRPSVEERQRARFEVGAATQEVTVSSPNVIPTVNPKN